MDTAINTKKPERDTTPLSDRASSSKDGEKKHKGRGAKARQAERFRMKKNEEFDQMQQKKILDFKISLGYTPKELFGERRMNPVVKPAKQIMIHTAEICTIADLTSEVLHTACKVPPAPGVNPAEAIRYDGETLKYVTALQVESKLFHAQAGTEFVPVFADQVVVQSVDLLLDSALLPLAVAVEQIGKFEIDGQVFVPSINGESDLVYSRLRFPRNFIRERFADLIEDPLPPGYTETDIVDHTGRRLAYQVNEAHAAQAIQHGIVQVRAGGNPENRDDYIINPEFLRAPGQFPYLGIVDFIPIPVHNVVPDLEAIVTRYAELRGRVHKKLTNCFLNVDLKAGSGTESQIVYTERMRVEGLVEVWSPRHVKDDALEIGAVLELGWVRDQFGNRGISAVETVINRQGGLQCLVEILTKKMR